MDTQVGWVCRHQWNDVQQQPQPLVAGELRALRVLMAMQVEPKDGSGCSDYGEFFIDNHPTPR